MNRSRRNFLQAMSMLAVGAHPWLARARAAARGELLLVGTGTGRHSTGKGIYAYDFDPATGELTQLSLAAAADNPTFLALSPDEKYLFAVDESGTYLGRPGGAASSYAFDKANMSLRKLSEVSSRGRGPTNIGCDHTGRCVFTANYGSGSVSSYRVDAAGRLSPVVSFFQYGTPPPPYHPGAPHRPPTGPRPRRSHPHRVTVSPNNRFLLVNDLGFDQIHIFHLDASTAVITPNQPANWQSDPHTGPRALRFHPNGKWVYCVCELKPYVYVLHWDGDAGRLETIQRISLEPADYHGRSAPADIVWDQQVRFAYVPSRLDDFMASFSVSPTTGKLTAMNHSPCGGKRPRHLAMDPSNRWILVANQDTSNIAVIRRNEQTGVLSDTFKSFPIGTPECVLFV